MRSVNRVSKASRSCWSGNCLKMSSIDGSTLAWCSSLAQTILLTSVPSGRVTVSRRASKPPLLVAFTEACNASRFLNRRERSLRFSSKRVISSSFQDSAGLSAITMTTASNHWRSPTASSAAALAKRLRPPSTQLPSTRLARNWRSWRS